MTIVWRAELLGSNQVEPNLVDVEVTDSINRFAKSALLTIEDENGTAASRYPRGERVELEYSTDSGVNYARRWTGTPVDTREKERDGDVLEVELVGYDFFLRRENVFRTFSSGTSLSTILEETVKNFTPVTWNASNVELVNDTTLASSLQFKGEKPDKIIDRVAVESADENYGVNDDFEFFFRPRNTDRSPSDILNGEWTDYDLPDESKRAINKVRLFYGEGNNRASVIVQDRAKQRELKDKLDANQNVVLGTSATYPNISTEANARTVANQILENRSPIQTGTVTTFDRFEMDPGDVFRLEIPDKNIDEDFRLAEIEYQWRRDRTIVTVAENSEGTDAELLTELSDDVNRIDARDADPDAPVVQDLVINSGVECSVATQVTQRETASDAFIAGYQRGQIGYERDRVGFRPASESRDVRTDTRGVVTNVGLNDFRSVLSGDTPASRDYVAVGSGSGPVNQTDNTLDTELERVDVDQVRQITNNGVEYEATISAGGSAANADITNIGLFTAASGGDMHQETRIDALTHSNTTQTIITLQVTLADDGDLEGIIPAVGRDRWRDLWAGFSSDALANALYGTDTAAESDSDTSLGNQVFSASIDKFNDRSVGEIDVIERLDSGEANGNDIGEVGEGTGDGTLYSRVVFEPISKTSDISIRLRHRLSAVNV
jgi:hypothetical protein